MCVSNEIKAKRLGCGFSSFCLGSLYLIGLYRTVRVGVQSTKKVNLRTTQRRHCIEQQISDQKWKKYCRIYVYPNILR